MLELVEPVDRDAEVALAQPQERAVELVVARRRREALEAEVAGAQGGEDAASRTSAPGNARPRTPAR